MSNIPIDFMKYVKLIARPDTWFKTGTEVYDYDYPYSDKKRITLEYWDQSLKECGHVCARGIRVCEDNPNENGMGYKAGDEREDGEYCHLDEFDVEIVDGN
jgi:hypothetical protein